MQQLPSDETRRLVPRLRTFAHSVVAGELGSLNAPKIGTQRSTDLDSKLAEWKEEPSLGLAVDLMSSAIVLGRSHDVEAIAWWTLNQRDSCAPSVIFLAESCTSPDPAQARWREDASLSARALLRRGRAFVQTTGADAMTLVDLCYAHLVLGNADAAVRAIKAALKFAPNSRLVLRAAARLWDHLGEPEVAHELLVRSDRTRADPWLIAAEIATASRANKSPRLFKRGLELIDNRRFAQRHLSELAGAIGTEFFLEGKKSKARPHFQFSLQDPTENAIAQAGWAHRRNVNFEFDVEKWATKRPDEARAWEARNTGDWSPGLAAAESWINEEPYSTAALGLGFFIAAILQDHDRQTNFAVQGWRTNPHAMCANNLAFALIDTGNFEKAERLLNRARSLKTEVEIERVALTATRGRLLMRRGQLDEGRNHYASAIEEAKKAKRLEIAAWAAAFRVREERLANSSEVGPAIQEFDKLAGATRDRVFDTLRDEFKALSSGEPARQQKNQVRAPRARPKNR